MKFVELAIPKAFGTVSTNELRRARKIGSV